jgi:hypothetical protein
MPRTVLEIRFPTLAGGVTLALVIGSLNVFGVHAGPPDGAPQQDAPTVKAVAGRTGAGVSVTPSAVELRERFPVVSLGKRLDYEARLPRVADHPKPKLADESRRKLDDLEKHYSRKLSGTVRADSLRLLHSAQVERFKKSEGFGISRMVRPEPAPQHLEYREPDAIPLAATSVADYVASPVATVVLPERGILEETGGAWTPSRDMLSSFHSQDQQIFASPWSLGWVKDRDQVAGFVPHGFGYLPELMHPETQTLPPGPVGNRAPLETRQARWLIARLELVSLLKFDEPAVYVSETLPRMKDLVGAKTRPLTDFEREALAALEAGDDLVTAPSTNDIDMVGAVRAITQCTGCHAAQRGELLGAFSYRLKRSPPLKAPARTARPSA